MALKRLPILVTASALFFALAAQPLVTAQGQSRAAAGRARLRAASRVTAARAGWITGFVWAANDAPVPGVQVRLRNLVTGRAEATWTDARGQFTFGQVEPGGYIIEAFDEQGRFVAVGSPFAVRAGDVVATFMRLPDRKRFVEGFRTAAASLVSTVAGLGVTALVPTGPPVSPEK